MLLMLKELLKSMLLTKSIAMPPGGMAKSMMTRSTWRS